MRLRLTLLCAAALLIGHVPPASAQLNKTQHDDGWLLAAARAPGLHGSIWRTDLWVMGQTFEVAGYITPPAAGELPEQPDSAVFAIQLFMSLVPAVLLFIAVLFALQYPISREKHRAQLLKLEINN